MPTRKATRKISKPPKDVGRTVEKMTCVGLELDPAEEAALHEMRHEIVEAGASFVAKVGRRRGNELLTTFVNNLNKQLSGRGAAR